MNGLPVKFNPIKAVYDEEVSTELQDKKLFIFSRDLFTQVANLQDYIELLLRKEGKGSQFSQNVPWNINVKQPQWTFKDELIAASVLLVLNYKKLASSKVLEILDKDHQLDDDERNWKVSNNWLKQALSLISFLISSQLFNNDIDVLSLDFLNFLKHLLDCSIQLNLLIKINSLKVIKIIQNDWNFDVDTKNHLIYLKVCIFISDQLAICEQLAHTLPEQKKTTEYIKIHRLYIKIYIAYYMLLANYEEGKLGMSIGIINYIKTHLLKSEEDSDESNNFKQKMKNKFTKSGQNEKTLIKEIASKKEFKLNKKFVKSLSSICTKDLINMIKLINLINLKLLKENDNIKFDRVSKLDEVTLELAKLPLGRKIPLTIDEVPTFMKDKQLDNGKQSYAGSGSYF